MVQRSIGSIFLQPLCVFLTLLPNFIVSWLSTCVRVSLVYDYHYPLYKYVRIIMYYAATSI